VLEQHSFNASARVFNDAKIIVHHKDVNGAFVFNPGSKNCPFLRIGVLDFFVIRCEVLLLLS
jgi:hypothetical protein